MTLKTVGHFLIKKILFKKLIMRKIQNLSFIIFIIFYFQLNAQAQINQNKWNLYIPVNVQKAYENGTRNYDGTPGKNYWQNSSDYKIKVFLEPKTRLISGEETITYYNNSPDTLTEIIFRLYQNMFKSAARDFQLNDNLLTEGIKIKKLSINGSEINMNQDGVIKVNDTNMTLKLSDSLPPNSNINFKIAWEFVIPNGKAGRMGTIDSTTFFVGYWYPQISVYDDIDGWDKYLHTGWKEFYNDFSNFDVEITVPNNFSVWSTGILQNPSEIFNEKYLAKYELAHESDTVINIISKEDFDKKIYKNENETNTWHYKAKNVTDFAFGTSDHYLWDALSFVVDDNTGQKVYVASAYNPDSKDFYQAAEVAKKSINYFSKTLPGVPFPFPCLTVFNGTPGGMEFPMIVNDQSSSSYKRLVNLTSHEIAHSYFPFYMGINERKYAWMDEGMATFIPMEFQMEEGKDTVLKRNVKNYERFAGYESEMPMIIPSALLSVKKPYRTSSYQRPGMAYYYLRYALGKEKFDSAIREYMKRWNGRHPIPYDFFFTFNEVTGKNLNWYWKPWFLKRSYPDLAVKKVLQKNDSIKILVEKVGDIPVPVYLKITGVSSVKEINKTAAI